MLVPLLGSDHLFRCTPAGTTQNPFKEGLNQKCTDFLSGVLRLSSGDTDKRKTRVKTIRFPESLARSLEKEAADQGTNVNSVVNLIMNEHFLWHRKAREFGLVTAPRQILMGLLETVDDETFARIGREVVPGVWKEMAEYWSGDSSPDGVLDSLSMRSRFNPGNRTKLTRDEGTYTIVFRHDFGRKWSILTKNAIEEFVKNSFHTIPQTTMGDSVVTARFKVRRLGAI